MPGSQILVAPVFNPEGNVHFYPPAGKWTNVQDGESYDIPEGGKWLTKHYDELNRLSVRDNTILASTRNQPTLTTTTRRTPTSTSTTCTRGQRPSVLDNGKDAGSVTVKRNGNQFMSRQRACAAS